MTIAVIPQVTVLYLRESTDDELGIDRHRDDLLALCTRQGWPIVPTSGQFIDNDQSASPEHRKAPRPAFTSMLAAARAGKVARIVAWHADRLVRHPRDAEDVIDVCCAHNVELWTKDGHVDLSNDTGRLVFRILAGVARGEVERKSARTKAAGLQRAAQGPAWWPTRPFGYRLADESVLEHRTKRKMVDGEMVTVKPKWAAGPVVLDRREAAAIRAAYKSVIAGGSLKFIAREWNSNGILTPKGNEWDGMAVKQVLLSPRNAALRTYQPDKAIEPEVVGKGDWTPIVTEQVWRSAVATLTNPARLTPGSGFNTRRYLLSGIAACSECGHTVSGIADTKKTGKPAYVCKQRGCLKVRRRVADVDGWVLGHIYEALARDLDVLMARKGVDTFGLLARLKEIDGEKGAAAAMVQPRLITLSQLAVINADFDAEIRDINAQMRDAEKAAVLAEFEGVPDVAAKFDSLTLDRQRAVVRLLCSVVIKPGQAPRRAFDEDLVLVTPNE
jgi:site-specific DNA recombinase